MKHRFFKSIAMKTVVLILTAAALVAAVGSGILVSAMAAAGLYFESPQELYDQWLHDVGFDEAYFRAGRTAAEKLGGCPPLLLNELYSENYLAQGHCRVSVYEGGRLVSQHGILPERSAFLEYTVQTEYPVPLDVWNENADSLGEPLYSRDVRVYNGEEDVYSQLFYYSGPKYRVIVELDAELVKYSTLYPLEGFYPQRYAAIAVLAGSLLLFIAGLVYLLWAAGRKPDGTVAPRGLNRLPLDLYFLLAGCAVIPLMLLLLELLSAMNGSDFLALYCAAAIADAVVISLVILGFLMALAAQVKLPDRAWLRRTLVGRLCAKLMQGVRVCLRGLRALMRMMPVMWQWFLTAVMLFFAMAFFWWVGGIGYGPSNPVAFFLFMVSGAAFAGAAGWGGYALGVLLTGAKKMSQGELSYQIPTRYLRGPFLDFACQLNALSGTAMVAAQKQTQAERMKTELITNVSHDIKTPLTSIINFVDLLQKPHTPEQEAEYLEVLARQSAHMKRLIEDLIELSKAATGSITAVPTRLDAAEAVNQALGEYADKLAAAELIPVFRQPEEPVYITADGRLVWRVLNNLFSNAVKYALPGTRLYVELSRQESRAILSLKNISRQELTVTAQELMERFVQGDASRTSGGSGLGLNIAQSLMEVQHGSLELTVDGDLFKVTLTFPSA